jgi:hypothetical protein
MSSENQKDIQSNEIRLNRDPHRLTPAVSDLIPFNAAILVASFVALLSSGCAHINAHSPSPLSRISATAERIFQNPNQKQTEIAALSASATSNSSEPGPTNANPSLAPNSGSAQLGLPASNELTPVSVSTVSFGDERSAYEQGRHDAMQAAYQQPVAPTYSNLQPPPQPNYVPQHQPQVYHPAHQPMMSQPMPVEPYNQQTYSQQIVQENYRQNYTGQPSPIIQQQPPFDPQQTGTGYLANGMNLVGTELRLDFRTATEIAYDLQDQNEALRKQLSASNAKIEQLSQKIQEQQATLSSTQDLLTKSNRLAALLREKIASQKVKVQNLEKEKKMIEENADEALKDIEATLDTMLIDTISKSK